MGRLRILGEPGSLRSLERVELAPERVESAA
jgi:hypothetical protein